MNNNGKIHGKRKKTKSNIKPSINPLSDARRVQVNDDENLKSFQKVGRKRSRNSKEVDTSAKKGKVQEKKEQSNGTTKLTKADLKARELWHKKSGAGYVLFVQYYASQPLGVVSDGALLENTAGRNKVVTSVTSHSIEQGRGLSRASKKRRKKKMKDGASAGSIHTLKNELTTNSNDTNYSIGEGSATILANALPLSKSYRNISVELQHAIQQQKLDCRHIKSYLNYLSQDLPLTFRIRQHQRSFEERHQLEEFKKKISKYHNLIQPVSYDPNQMIYQAVKDTGLVKSTLGKISPQLKSLIVESTVSGLVARQELGSMLPVLALHALDFLRYGSRVLDMCSSPGSKMLQALEIVASMTKVGSNNCKPGRVVANDIHPLRIEALKDAVSRSGLPSSFTDRIIYTNHDATTFPTPKSGKLFDCIIADVPCSGDGTIRKDPRILSGWMPSIGNSLHSVQKKILMRAMRVVKVGGVVAYSTCSLNPIEDEAVVASALSWANDSVKNDQRTKSFELLEWPSHLLPKLRRSKGVNRWSVANFSENVKNEQRVDTLPMDDMPSLEWFDSFDSAKEANMVHAVESMWPPSNNTINDLNLDRCVRLQPQMIDCGGFFVALLRRTQ